MEVGVAAAGPGMDVIGGGLTSVRGAGASVGARATSEEPRFIDSDVANDPDSIADTGLTAVLAAEGCMGSAGLDRSTAVGLGSLVEYGIGANAGSTVGATAIAVRSVVRAGCEKELVTDQRMSPPVTEAITLSQMRRTACLLRRSLTLIRIFLRNLFASDQSQGPARWTTRHHLFIGPCRGSLLANCFAPCHRCCQAMRQKPQ